MACNGNQKFFSCWAYWEECILKQKGYQDGIGRFGTVHATLQPRDPIVSLISAAAMAAGNRSKVSQSI